MYNLLDITDLSSDSLWPSSTLFVQLEELFELMATDKLRLEVAKVLPLDQAAEAQKLVETGRTRGKVVLQIP